MAVSDRLKAQQEQEQKTFQGGSIEEVATINRKLLGETNLSQASSFDVPGPALTCSRSGSNSACSSLANSVIVGRRLSTTSTPEVPVEPFSGFGGPVSGEIGEIGETSGSMAAELAANTGTLISANTFHSSCITAASTSAVIDTANTSSSSSSPHSSHSDNINKKSSVSPPALVDANSSPQSIASKSFTATTTTTTNSSLKTEGSVSSSDSRQATFGSTFGKEESNEAANETGITTTDGTFNSSSGGEQVKGDEQQEDELLQSERQEQEQSLMQAAGNSSQQEQTSFPIRRSSQELSTVSEVSEEMSNGGHMSLLAYKQQQQSNQHSLVEEGAISDNAAHEEEQLQQQQPMTTKLHNEQLTVMQDLATEHDLAHSEYTLRSQLSEETPGLLSEATSESSASVSRQPLDRMVEEQVSQASTSIGQQRSGNGEGLAETKTTCRTLSEQVISDSCSSTNQIEANASSTATKQQRQKQQQEQRRRSSGSGTNNSSSPSPIQSTTRAALGMKSPVDCPYVHDIMPLSPDSRSPPPVQSLVAAITSVGGHQTTAGHYLTSRLSHDDTMEAIEDDIEGEEMELMEQMKQAQTHPQPQQPHRTKQAEAAAFSIAPPAAFVGVTDDNAAVGSSLSLLADRSCTPAESIKEEEEVEEEEEQEEEEESSISVSQHGVIVSQELPASKRRRKSSSSHSASQITPSNMDDDGVVESNMKPKNETKFGTFDDKKELEVAVEQKLSHESSADSGGATQAILEHLSKHHRELTLDEPSPTLEQSRPVDPQLRRESWRRESARKQTTTSNNTPQTNSNSTSLELDQPTEQRSTQRQQESMANLVMVGQAASETRATTSTSSTPTATTSNSVAAVVATSNTGTMKRKSKTNKPAESCPSPTTRTMTNNNSGSDDDNHVNNKNEQASTVTRGPPLAQTKVAATNVVGGHADSITKQQGANVSQGRIVEMAGQSSVSLPTDTSICSSCSCLEEAVAYEEQQPVVVSARAQQQAGGTSQAGTTLASGPSGERAAWMSQEEGTVFTENYWLAHWLYISEHEESEIWRRAIDMNIDPPGGVEATSQKQQQQAASGGESSLTTANRRETSQDIIPGMPKEMTEIGSTSSERSFSAKYKSTTRKMIHRRASIEMYKRIMNNNLKREKRVEISRSNGEFGFRIHGSRPVVVSAIERGTSAETCGLQVGDLIYAINGTNILDMAHSDVVKLAHSGKLYFIVIVINDKHHKGANY